jgi:hypothetical protein
MARRAGAWSSDTAPRNRPNAPVFLTDRMRWSKVALLSVNGKIASLFVAAVSVFVWTAALTLARAQNAYPSVGDIPPRPDKPAMTVDEQSKLRKELNEARERQKSQLKLKAGEAPPRPHKATEGNHSR